MTPRQIAQDVAEMAAKRIGEEIRAGIAWKWQHPYVAHRYHAAMSTALPNWRWLARRYHRSEARRFRAVYQASDDAAKCLKAEALSR